MIHMRVEEDFEACRNIWERIRPMSNLFDLWPVRICFATSFGRHPYFIVAEEKGRITGLLPLSRTDDPNLFGFFPGELWSGKTWLEQNRITAAAPHVARMLLAHIPGGAHLRYMPAGALFPESMNVEQDEIGYLFLPGRYAYDFNGYMQEFSAKSRKKLGREQDALASSGVSWRYDRFADVDHFFRMNLESFGGRSYFNDPRFQKSFEKLIAWLSAADMLRITAVLIGGRIAAVDVGAVLTTPPGRTVYTVLAGGTDPAFSGVAKMINFHHIAWACRMQVDEVDFLCGNFGWKERFHLTPRPLYQLRVPAAREPVRTPAYPVSLRMPSLAAPVRLPAAAGHRRHRQPAGPQERSTEIAC